MFEFVFLTPYINSHTTPIRIYDEPYEHKFCAVHIFFNITRRQAISPVAKFHHVLGTGFMIQRVILIFIKCLSANQNQLFYMKVLYMNLHSGPCLRQIYMPLGHGGSAVGGVSAI